jgi:hypothetical protein
LPESKHLVFFLTKRTLEQQKEAAQSNVNYLSSLQDWANGIDPESDNHDKSNEPLVQHLPQIRTLIKELVEYYNSLSQQTNQLRVTNNKLKEENNRLSSAPAPRHKDPAFSKLQQDHEQLVNQYTELNSEYQKYQTLWKNFPETRTTEELVQRHNECIQNYRTTIEAQHKLEELQREVQNTIAHLPNVKTIHEARTAIKGLIQAEKHSDALVGELQASLINWENVGLALLKSQEGKPPTPLEAEQQADHLVEALRLALEKIKTMSNNTPGNTGSGMMPDPLNKEQCQFIWNQVPASFRHLPENTPTPETSEALVAALNHSIICNHPREAAVALGDATGNQPWTDSVEQMEDLYAHECPTTAAIPINTQRLFKVSEVPEFANTKEYELYRSQLQRFLRAHGRPQRSEYGQALERILQAFTAPSAKVAAASWQVTDLIRPNWEETTDALISALDRKFEDNNLLEEAQLKWYQTKLKDGTDINEFFNHYEAAAAVYLLAQIRKGIPATAQISPAVVTARLIQILPPYLRNALKLRLTSQGIMWENMSINDLRPHLEDLWRYMPKPAAIGHNTNNRFQTASSRTAPVQGQNAARQPKPPKTYACGFHGNYDTSPPVPQNLRGSIFPDPRDASSAAENLSRRQRCSSLGCCINCRRPRDQHQTNGTNYRPITMTANTRQASQHNANPGETINGHQLLEAPPSRATSPTPA